MCDACTETVTRVAEALGVQLEVVVAIYDAAYDVLSEDPNMAAGLIIERTAAILEVPHSLVGLVWMAIKADLRGATLIPMPPMYVELPLPPPSVMGLN